MSQAIQIVSAWPFWLKGLLVPVASGLVFAGFFFTITRAPLLVRAFLSSDTGTVDHLGPRQRVYPVYTQPWLIRLIDRQPLVSGILLGQYGKLVSHVVNGLGEQQLNGQNVLITACAFGNVLPRVAQAAASGNAGTFQVLDLYASELDQVRNKLNAQPEQSPQIQLELIQGDACVSPLASESVMANLLFFLLHELPPGSQLVALREACRVIKPGGRLYIGEFHRPSFFLMRWASWLYFQVFEPWSLNLWGRGDPVLQLTEIPGMRVVQRHLHFLGNFQVIVAEKQA